MLPQWHVKDPGHSAKSTGCKLRLNTHTPLTQRSRSGLTMPLSSYSLGTYPETSSHTTCHGTFGHSRLTAEPLWTNSGIKSAISARELISTLKKKAQAGNKWLNVPPKSHQYHTTGLGCSFTCFTLLHMLHFASHGSLCSTWFTVLHMVPFLS